jgi:hypothetical protein
MTDHADVSEALLHDANPGIWMMAVDAMAGYCP